MIEWAEFNLPPINLYTVPRGNDMQRYRGVVDNTTFRSIDSLGNFIYQNQRYYMQTCPACHSTNPDHAIASGKCYRCGYTLSYKDEGK